LKNACWREALGTLALNWKTDDFVTADTLTQNMPKGEKPVFTTRKPLDLLRDDLAMQAFTLKHLLYVWYSGQPNNGPSPAPEPAAIPMETRIHHPSLTVIRTKALIRHSSLAGR
jgi:hypothetical protein